MKKKAHAHQKSFLAKEHKFDSLVKSLSKLSLGLSVINEQMRIVWVNEVVSNVFGPPENLYGKHCYDVFNHRKRVCTNCPTLRAFKTGKPGYRAIQRSFDKEGKRKYFAVSSTPITSNGRVVEVLEVVQDVSKDVVAKRQNQKYKCQLKNLNLKLAHTNKSLTTQTINLSKASNKIDNLNKKLKEQIINKSFELNIAMKELTTVYSVSREIISTLNPQEVFSLIAKIVCSIINTKACVLRVFDEEMKRLVVASYYGISSKYVDTRPLRLGEGLSGIIAKTREPAVCPQVSREESVTYSYYINKEGYNSAVGVPIVFGDKVFGTMITYDDSARSYSKADLMLLSTFASQVAIAIRNAQLHEKVHFNYLDTVNALALAMEARDPYTHGHSERVTTYAIELSKSLGVSRKQMDIIKRCGKLHDVGKIGVPDTILMKPSPLSLKEREIIQLHPVKGVEMLSPLKFLEPGFPLIQHHHERFDGMGYPHGLKKEGIPLIARIFACADAFDAMTSNRPYREKLSIKKATEELQDNSGGQFDPCVVKKIIPLIKNKILKVVDV